MTKKHVRKCYSSIPTEKQCDGTRRQQRPEPHMNFENNASEKREIETCKPEHEHSRKCFRKRMYDKRTPCQEIEQFKCTRKKIQRNYSDAAIWSRLANNGNARGANSTLGHKFDSKRARPQNRILFRSRIQFQKVLVANGTDISQQRTGQQITPKDGAPKK